MVHRLMFNAVAAATCDRWLRPISCRSNRRRLAETNGRSWAAVSPTRRSLQDLLLGSVVVYDWHRDRGTRAMAPEEAPR